MWRIHAVRPGLTLEQRQDGNSVQTFERFRKGEPLRNVVNKKLGY